MLCQLGQDLAAKYLGCDPVCAHTVLNREEFLRCTSDLQKQFTNHPDAERHFTEALLQTGVDPTRTAIENWFPLRVRPPGKTLIERNTAGVGIHRDLWYACPRGQNNWWAPIFPFDSSGGLTLYPEYWSKPVPNTSAGWSISEFRKQRANATATGASFDDLTEISPRPAALESLPHAMPIDIVMEPGDILCFSAAHLHASRINTGERIRFSTEIRTINLDDLISRAGPPNLDTKSSGNTVGDFKMVYDGAPLLDKIEGKNLDWRNGDDRE